MPRARLLLPLCVLPLLLAAADAPLAVPLSDKAQALLAGRTAGAPVPCIQLSRIRSSEIVDPTAIIYRESSRRWYVNQPDGGRCSSLDRRRVLITRLSSSRLCDSDMITIAESDTPITYGACGLSRFVPYTR